MESDEDSDFFDSIVLVLFFESILGEEVFCFFYLGLGWWE